jgi:hypothetical protein
MAARNKPAGIRSLVYGVGKSKGGIEGLSVSGGGFLLIMDGYDSTINGLCPDDSWLLFPR